MFRRFRHLIRSAAHDRRTLAGVFAGLFLLLQAFSSFLVMAESDHDCNGPDCHVCHEIQSCIELLQVSGPAPAECGRPADAVEFVREAPAAVSYRAPATTLMTLDVRFDE